MPQIITDWWKPMLIGFVLGMLVMPFGFNFSSKGTMDDAVSEAGTEGRNEAYVAVYVPGCVAEANKYPEQLATIMGEPSYRQRSAIGDTGWSLYPEGASTSVQTVINQACLDALKS